MKFLILNGPNINLARWSEPGVPGEVDYTGLMDYVQAGCDQLEYYFYVELVGDAAAGETAALLRELDRICRTVRLLGVYTK